MEATGQYHASAVLFPIKNLVTSGWVIRRAGLGDLEKRKNLFLLPDFEPRTVQPVPNRRR
jgi:hypothetical protein